MDLWNAGEGECLQFVIQLSAVCRNWLLHIPLEGISILNQYNWLFFIQYFDFTIG